MNLLLDTCTLLWMALEPKKLSAKARESCEDEEKALCLSAVSVWEISQKCSLGKLNLEMPTAIFIEKSIEILQLKALSFDVPCGIITRNTPQHPPRPFRPYADLPGTRTRPHATLTG